MIKRAIIKINNDLKGIFSKVDFATIVENIITLEENHFTHNKKYSKVGTRRLLFHMMNTAQYILWHIMHYV